MKDYLIKLLVTARDQARARKIRNYAKRNRFDLIADHFRINDVVAACDVKNNGNYQIRLDLEGWLLKELSKKDRIKVAFVLYTASMWSCDELFDLFEKDNRFEPYIVLARYSLDANLETFPTFEKSKRFFEETGKACVSVPLDTPVNDCYQKMGSPDVVFYLTPYSTLLPVGMNQLYLPAKVLTIYIPYSYMLLKVEEKYDLPGMVASWRHFCDSKKYRELLISNCKEREYNTFYCGYPKMDIYDKPCDKQREDIWKIKAGADPSKVKCIIYAPHHSIPGTDSSLYHGGTFDQNYRFILDYAKQHALTTSWVFKPHPNLKMTVLEVGLFKTEEEYNAYIAEWNNLENGYCMEESTYYDVFKTSDGMITDSVSFLAEYQFTGKPLLMLTRNNRQYNEFGEELCDVLYKSKGDDFLCVSQFLDDVVMKGQDTMKEERTEFFERNIAYMKTGGSSASMQIYDHIVKAIWK